MPPSPLMSEIVASSSIEMQSHNTLPCTVRIRTARWPIAKRGCVATPRMPGSYWCQPFTCVTASFAFVVQPCSDWGTYCHSSSKIGQFGGGFSAGGYCVPQVVQMNTCILPSVVAFAFAQLAAEQVIDKADIHQNQRQQRQRPEPQEKLRRRHRGRVPDRHRERHQMGEYRDCEPRIAEHEHHDGGEEGRHVATSVKPAPCEIRGECGDRRHRPQEEDVGS